MTSAARIANSSEEWDALWGSEETSTWREQALSPVYERIVEILGVVEEGDVVDIGGGVGYLASRLLGAGWDPLIIDISGEACRQAQHRGLLSLCADVAEMSGADIQEIICNHDWVVATEFLEHLEHDTRELLLTELSAAGQKVIFSVPNNRLGPDEEPQHTIKWTALEFKQYLEDFYDNVRVEVYGPYMLGVCGIEKQFSMSVCFPAKDEEKDIERTLASFRGIADEIVVGVDPRSSDRTEEIARQYADIVFTLQEPSEGVAEGGVNFAWIRNQCMDKCNGDWIFMTEAHESLMSGQETLLRLDEVVPEEAVAGYVFRNSIHGASHERWGFPWLCRNQKHLRYTRSTHNILQIPAKAHTVKLPAVNTLHQRHATNAGARAEQRKKQNRKTLFDDWRTSKNPVALFYLGQEWRGHDEERSMEWYKKFVAEGGGDGEAQYQARLILAKYYWKKDDIRLATETLLDATRFCWDRIEHWVWLGDLCFHAEDYEKALQFYRYAGTRIGQPPFTAWWIDMGFYSYLTAQRLAMAFHAVGANRSALHYAKLVRELLPEAASEAAKIETDGNIKILEEILDAA